MLFIFVSTEPGDGELSEGGELIMAELKYGLEIPLYGCGDPPKSERLAGELGIESEYEEWPLA